MILLVIGIGLYFFGFWRAYAWYEPRVATKAQKNGWNEAKLFMTCFVWPWSFWIGDKDLWIDWVDEL